MIKSIETGLTALLFLPERYDKSNFIINIFSNAFVGNFISKIDR